MVCILKNPDAGLGGSFPGGRNRLEAFYEIKGL